MTHHSMNQNEQSQLYTTHPSKNHGGHELFDVHETLSHTVSALNQIILFRPHIQDPQLLTIVDRQYRFLLDEYNITVEAFQTGQKPSKSTEVYQMTEDHQFLYGMTPTQPKKPMQSAEEISDEVISGFLLGAAKAGATSKAAAALETTNPVVRRVLADSIPNCIEMAYELSLYQNKHQYYQVPQLNAQDMNELLQSFAPSQGQPGMPPPNNLQ